MPPLDRKEKVTTIRFSRAQIIKMTRLAEQLEVSGSEVVRMGLELVDQKVQGEKKAT